MKAFAELPEVLYTTAAILLLIVVFRSCSNHVSIAEQTGRDASRIMREFKKGYEGDTVKVDTVKHK